MRIERKAGSVAALLLVALVITGLSASLAVGDANTKAAVGLRAKLSARTQQARTGMFVATLRGASLRWSLAYEAVGKGRLTARIRARGVQPAKLCGNCATLVRGRANVSRDLARAMTQRRATVELRFAGAAAPALSGPVRVQQVPVLVISAPKPGETVTLPTEVSYSTTSIGVRDASAALQLEVFVANSDGKHVVLPLAEPSGTVVLPDAKDAYLVGNHDLTFRLLNADGVPLPNPEATVVVPRLTIQGRKGG